MSHKTGPTGKNGYYFRIIRIIAIIWSLYIPGPLLAETFIIEKSYVYQASDADSKISCRAIAIEQVKRQLLEELGTYLESQTEVKDFQLAKETIVVLTAGIVKVDVLDEEWDGVTYRLRAKIAADPEEVARSIDQLRQDRQKMKELEETKQRADELLAEVEKLKQELELAKADIIQKEQKEYIEAIKELSAIDWFDRGYSSTFSEDYDVAISAFSRATEINPQFAAAYNNRGAAYAAIGSYDQAINDFNRVIIINPGYASAYYNRGLVHFNLGNQKAALSDYDRAIKIDPRYATAYHNRGLVHIYTNDHKRAIKDFDRAIELNPASQDAYRNRGAAYTKLGMKDEAAKDFNRATELASRRRAAESTSRYMIHGTNRDYQFGSGPNHIGTINNRSQTAPSAASFPKTIGKSRDSGLSQGNRSSSPPPAGKSSWFTKGNGSTSSAPTTSTPVFRGGHSGSSSSGRPSSSSSGGGGHGGGRGGGGRR